MRRLFLFFSLFLFLPAISQVAVSGIVIDSTTRKPVPYALALTGDGKHGALADQTGVFESAPTCW